MDAYDELRKQARAKRDKIIQSARAECNAALRRISSLQAMITNESRPAIGQAIRTREKSLTDLIREALPMDGTFTIPELCAMLYENPLTCKYKEASIRGQVRVLNEAGAIRKVGRRNGQILWVRAESNIEASPLAAMTLCEVAEKLIGELGPMRTTEIVVRMKERGFRTDESSRQTNVILRQQMSRISGRFVKDTNGRWCLPAHSKIS